VRRLFPALMIVLTAVFAVGWWLQYPDEFQRTGQQIVASAGFIANIYFWQHSNYFAPAASTYPLLHIWSLGVEEQFYVAWPLTLLVLARRPQLVGPVIIVTFFGSLALSITYFVHGPAAFYLPFTRAWELMLGAGLAWYSRSYPAAESSLSPLPSRSRG
jgi:peptidoglycan/LPS O-acetylase OafA/YrhL